MASHKKLETAQLEKNEAIKSTLYSILKRGSELNSEREFFRIKRVKIEFF